MKSFQEFASLLEDNSYLEKGKKASIVQGAVSGNPKALWLLSKQRIAENDIYSGETLLFQAAFENCPEAQGDIGDVYFYGRFNRENARRDPENINTIIQDDTTAANWYKQGYKNGSDYCTGQLGVCYDYGIGVEQNLENAQTLLQSGLLCKEQDFFNRRERKERKETQRHYLPLRPLRSLRLTNSPFRGRGSVLCGYKISGGNILPSSRRHCNSTSSTSDL